MFKNLKKRTEGFTIIEVLIVLAIAGLIMLIVFLAVPALQRNQRNTARNSDASRWAAAVTECLANRNNTSTGVCDGAVAANLNVGNLSQLTTATAGGAGSTVSVGIVFNAACNTTNAGTGGAVASTKSFAVLYTLEPSITRCVGS
jgi:prepilin-type N-terminal cleavage/methylation domain-containing protein